MTKNQPALTLNLEQVRFIAHFVNSYKENFEKGNFEEANHDACAIGLFFMEIFDEAVVYAMD
jgi:hypothetical protein